MRLWCLLYGVEGEEGGSYQRLEPSLVLQTVPSLVAQERFLGWWGGPVCGVLHVVHEDHSCQHKDACRSIRFDTTSPWTKQMSSSCTMWAITSILQVRKGKQLNNWVNDWLFLPSRYGRWAEWLTYWTTINHTELLHPERHLRLNDWMISWTIDSFCLQYMTDDTERLTISFTVLADVDLLKSSVGMFCLEGVQMESGAPFWHRGRDFGWAVPVRMRQRVWMPYLGWPDKGQVVQLWMLGHQCVVLLLLMMRSWLRREPWNGWSNRCRLFFEGRTCPKVPRPGRSLRSPTRFRRLPGRGRTALCARGPSRPTTV